ncbi:CDP-alcohol phosphatidyltransferase family protein [Symbioplanes lichenis]|uniref:CDP-alcohol phosphatidyltransferase family protein n=1 Tax=Symbioplanes lichenis TaxID=1629072 RepID=UPI002738DB18|nr:CDP-alcohol phosphatidyltransferase family protein [Actinoplanes lichenis]
MAVDPVAVRLLPVLLRFRRVTPDVLTGVALLLGLGAAASTLTGHVRLGALLFEARFLVDCLDGKVARIRGTGTAFGAFFDRTADLVGVLLSYVALSVVAVRAVPGHQNLMLLPALLCAVAAAAEFLLKGAKAGAGGPAGGLGDTAWGRWCSARRLATRPWTVEAETLALFAVPLLVPGLAWAGLLCAAVFYLIAAAHDVTLAGVILR